MVGVGIVGTMVGAIVGIMVGVGIIGIVDIFIQAIWL
jgi:hypothetical protein